MAERNTVPNLEAKATDGNPVFTPKKWLERFLQFCKREHKIDITPLMKGEEITNWSGKERTVQEDFIWGVGPEALYQITRAEYKTEYDSIKILDLIRLFTEFYMPKRNTYHNRGDFFWAKQTQDETPEEFWRRLIEALISTKEKHIIKEEPIQRMERYGTKPKNKNFGNRPCRYCSAPNWTPLHKSPATEVNCNKCGKKGHYAKACRHKFNCSRTVKRLTEDETNESNESSCESEEDIQHIKEIKKIEETNKHYTATVKINGIIKEFIIDTGSPISIMPPDQRIMKLTEIQKVTNRYQDVNKNEVKFRGKIPVNIEYENNKQKMEIPITERYYTPIGQGLDENIQTHNRKNTIGRQQPIRERENIRNISRLV